MERGNSHVLWGNFSTGIISGTDFAQVNRSLYGAQLKFRTEQANDNGDAYLSVDAFGAQQGTVPHRDEFRGTGNSVYFLSFQDLADRRRAPEQSKSAIRSTTWSKSAAMLVYGEDYDIDYIQGRVILFEPLPSTADDGFPCYPTAPASAGDEVYLGLRVRVHAAWRRLLRPVLWGHGPRRGLGKYVNLGATAIRDQRGLIDKQLARKRTPQSHLRRLHLHPR